MLQKIIAFFTIRITIQLGTIGMRVNERLYFDMFFKPYWGFYINDSITRRWYNIRRRELLRVQVLDVENARRLFSRTLKPWKLVYLRSDKSDGWPIEVVSYPFVDDVGFIRVMARLRPGDPCTAEPISCERLRPLDMNSKPRGIPASDPLPLVMQ